VEDLCPTGLWEDDRQQARDKGEPALGPRRRTTVGASVSSDLRTRSWRGSEGEEHKIKKTVET